MQNMVVILGFPALLGGCALGACGMRRVCVVGAMDLMSKVGISEPAGNQ